MQAALVFLRNDPFDVLPKPQLGTPSSPPSMVQSFSPPGPLSRSSTLSVNFTSSPPRPSTRVTRALSFPSSSSPTEARGVEENDSRPQARATGLSNSLNGHYVRDRVRSGSDCDAAAAERARRDSEVMPPPAFVPPREPSRSRSRSRNASKGGIPSPTERRVLHMSMSSSRLATDALPVQGDMTSLLPELHVRPQIILRTHRQPMRSFHLSEEGHLRNHTISNRVNLGRSLSSTNAGHALSSDMRRSRSDGMGKRLSIDSWRSLFGKSPASEESLSPRSSSPAGNFERSTSHSSELDDEPPDTWWGWGRKRFSSVASNACKSFRRSPDSCTLSYGRSSCAIAGRTRPARCRHRCRSASNKEE